MNYRFAGKDKTLALGVYPDVSLAAARKKRDDVREKLAAGIDPGEAKRLEQRAARLAAANSFEAVAHGWMDERKTYVKIGQYDKTLARFTSDVFPWLGRRPIAEIDAPEILTVLKRIGSRGARFTAHRVRKEISRYSATLSRRGIAGLTRHATFWMRSRHPKPSTLPPLPSQRRSGKCFGPSTAFQAPFRSFVR